MKFLKIGTMWINLEIDLTPVDRISGCGTRTFKDVNGDVQRVNKDQKEYRGVQEHHVNFGDHKTFGQLFYASKI